MIGPEAAALPGRLHPIYLEGRPLQLETNVARQLGLRDGQVVEASVELRGDTLKMLLNGRMFDLPPGLRFNPGETIWLRAHAQATGWLLKPTEAPGSAPATSALPSPADRQTALSSRLFALSMRPPMAPVLMNMFQPSSIAAMMQLAGSPELAVIFQRMSLTMGKLTPGDLQSAVQNSGFWLESMLGEGQSVPGTDQKTWLRRMIRSLGERPSPEKAGLEKALDDVEAAQVESLAAQGRGEINFAMVLPFINANPVEIRFFRQARRPNEEAPPFTVNIHTDNAQLGEIWLKTSIARASHVELMMWALREDVATLARQHSEGLRQRLREAGLTMDSFRVFNSARPSLPDSWTPSGAILDVRA